ncbi:MAG TPA: type II secretion system F family protein, partial [Humibacter sp.]|nr:type II secretion system F family protein [Humibacter sp.]
MTPMMAWGVLCGLGLGLGLWSLAALLPRLTRPRLADRVAPYLVDVSDAAWDLVQHTRSRRVPVVGALLDPALRALRTGTARMLGGTDALTARLRQAASPLTVDEFRLRQVAWALGGLAAGTAVVIAMSASAQLPPVVAVVAPIVLGACGFVLRDQLLTRAITKRLARMAEELPTVLELLTLSLSAGEGVHDALRRVARSGSGELAAELGRVVAETGMGVPLATALGEASRDVRLPQFTRCVDAVVTALQRGTPVVEVLRAQADDARETGKRDLLEQAGKKEIGMLVPLVFLILP